MIKHTHGLDNDFAFPGTISVYFIRDGKSLMAPLERSVFIISAPRTPAAGSELALLVRLCSTLEAVHKGVQASFSSNDAEVQTEL